MTVCPGCKDASPRSPCRECINQAIFDENIWYIPPEYGYFKIKTDENPVSQLQLDARARNDYWHLRYWTMEDSREVEQYIVNSCGITPQEQVHQLYLFCTRLSKSKSSIFTQAVWHELIHNILCLKSKKLYLTQDSRYNSRQYADYLLRWLVIHHFIPPMCESISEAQLYHIVNKWNKVLKGNHPDCGNMSGLNMWFSTIMLKDYRLPFLHDKNLIIKLTRLYELRALRLIILSSTQENSHFAFLGGKPILCHEISRYLVGNLQV